MSGARAEHFERLYRDNVEKVFKLVIGLTGNEHDAEEVTQEAFLRAFRSYDNFRGECAFSTWIYRIAMNVANDYLKHRAKFPCQSLTEDYGYVLDEILDPDPSANPETELLAGQAKVKCLHSLTECFTPEQRRVFCLAVTLGLPHKMVGEILDCSVGSVKTTLHRAKERWFSYMEDRCGLIKKSNPCSCSQWIRFGLSQGWFKSEAQVKPPVVSPVQAREEIGQMKALREIYCELYPETADKAYAQRIREGIGKKEWGIFFS